MKILDLELDNQGTYVPKGSVKNNHKDILRNKAIKCLHDEKKANNNVQQFFDGMDMGLSFFENLQKRIDRTVNLKHKR